MFAGPVFDWILDFFLTWGDGAIIIFPCLIYLIYQGAKHIITYPYRKESSDGNP